MALAMPGAITACASWLAFYLSAQLTHQAKKHFINHCIGMNLKACHSLRLQMRIASQTASHQLTSSTAIRLSNQKTNI